VDDRTVVEASEATFESAVIAPSFEAPVVVDFWAEWCGPCRVLGPVLERLADESSGAWRLVKVDVDANPALAAAFGVQGIPAVHAFKDGRKVAEFVGALPEAQVRAWLARLGPTEGDLAFDQGVEAERAGDLEAAAAAYRRGLALEPAHAGARGALERVELRLRSGDLDETALMTRLAADAADVEAAIGLADVRASGGRLEEAFELLLAVVRSSGGDDRNRARLHLLKLLATVPPEDPRAVAARRSLSLALY
jgi:putative thioredoxin